MTLYATLVNRFVMPVIEAHKAEGFAKGRAEGRAESHSEWRDWNRRRMDADTQGRPFDEPPPGDHTDC